MSDRPSTCGDVPTTHDLRRLDARCARETGHPGAHRATDGRWWPYAFGPGHPVPIFTPTPKSKEGNR